MQAFATAAMDATNAGVWDRRVWERGGSLHRGAGIAITFVYAVGGAE